MKIDVIRESPCEINKIVEVVDGKNSYEIKVSDGFWFMVDKKYGVKPEVGQTAKFYGKGIGFTIRGLAINEQVVFYRTEEQEEVRFKKWVEDENNKEKKEFITKGKAKLDKDYKSLPKCFQLRIQKFRNNNPDFRWKYENYEMFCCKTAMDIVRKIEKVDTKVREDFINGKLSHDETDKLLKPSHEHSGNTWGMACYLAKLYLLKREDDVIKLHGALAPMVGSEEYGCVPRKAVMKCR